MINGWFVNNQDMHWFASNFTPNTVDVSHLDTSSLIGDPCYIQVHQFILNINKKIMLKANYQILLPEFYNLSSNFSNGLKILFPLIYTIISEIQCCLNPSHVLCHSYLRMKHLMQTYYELPADTTQPCLQ